MQEKNKFEQQKKEFQSTLSMFSHEIRNPLALITSELQMLSDHHPQLCLDEHWDNIMENLNYIRELLDELSRYQNAGHLSLVSTDTSLWLDRITNTFRPALDYLGIVLETDIPKDLPHLELDQTKIRIAASAVSDGIQITVHDNGCGMTAQQTEQIFFPFVTYKPGGTGLGLAVTRQIIEAHHGTLRVESVPGEGTIFYILLPLG